MKLFEGPKIPTPFGGEIKLPDFETPPLELPKMPSDRQAKAIAHGLGEDATFVIALIPYVGDLVADTVVDMHHAEIKKILTPDEFSRFTEYDKGLPTSLALVRALCFEKV